MDPQEKLTPIRVQFFRGRTEIFVNKASKTLAQKQAVNVNTVEEIIRDIDKTITRCTSAN